MDTIIIFLLAICLMSTGCSMKEPSSPSDHAKPDHIIRLAEAFGRPEEVRLSELVDSIAYIPLETREECLLNSFSGFQYHAPYIFNGPLVFDFNGRFIHRLGRQGQGPGEEPGNYWEGIWVDPCFYTTGCKLIGYDKKGNFNGKEMILLTVAEGLYPFETSSGRIGYIDTWEKAGKNLLISAPNDSLYLLDADFQLLNASGLTPEEKNYRFANNVHYIQLFTAFRDSVLYYNYSNDTVYRVIDTKLVPRWVIDMQNYKLPAMTAEKKKKLVEELSHCIRNGLGSTDPESVIKTGMDASELVRLAKGKKLIYAVYETKNYVFITWSDYDNINAELRQLDSYPPQLAYYDKRTGKTVVVKGRGLIDDMDRYDEIYYPTFGIYENKLIAYFWPYELHETIQKRQAAGKKVSPALLDLAARVNDEDNPILMVAYLKE